MRWQVLVLACLATRVFAAVAVPVGGLIQHPEHFFDLDHKSVVMRPGKPPRVRSIGGLLPRGEGAAFGRFSLPFRFPFAGRLWTEAYLNLTGSVTFGAPDGDFPYRVTWPDGTMRTRAAMAEFAAVRGESFLIAALWGIHDRESAKVWMKRSPREVIITWDVARHAAPYEGYTALGRNLFQARLRSNGEVEFRFDGVAEKDAIVGLFAGLPPGETKLADGATDAGSLLHFTAAATGAETRVYIVNGDIGTLLRHAAEGPQSAGFMIQGSRGAATDPIIHGMLRQQGGALHFYLPKLALTEPDRFRWKIGDDSSLAEARVRPWRFGADLSSGQGRVEGNFYEVFHYPFLWKSRHATFQSISRHKPVDAELAIAFTDFRIDDLHNHGSSNAADSVPLSMAGPVYLGPRFAETIVTPERTYKNHAFGVGWMAHEMIHMWGVRLNYRLPVSGADGHWAPLFETRVVAPVAPLFADKPYREGSVMGGMEVWKNEDGTHSGAHSGGAVSGLSAMDLWLMGLIQPNEAPAGHEEMRLVQEEGFATVRLRDLAAEIGPPKTRPPHGFRQAVYVLHENGRGVDPAALGMANNLERWLLRYYEVASQGRMKVTAADP